MRLPGLTSPAWHGERRKRSPRFYPFSSTLGVTLFGTAGSLDSLNSPNYLLSSAVAANAIRWKVEQLQANQLFDASGSGAVLFTKPWYVSVFARDLAIGSPLTPDTGGGVAIGAPTAWPVPANDANPYIMLRSRHDALNSDYVLIVNPAGGPTTTTVLTGPAAGLNLTRFMELSFKPGEYVRAFLNGILGAEQTANLPSTNGTGQGFGVLAGLSGAAPAVAQQTRFWEGYAENIGKVS